MLLIEGGKLGDQPVAQCRLKKRFNHNVTERLALGESAPQIVDPARQCRMEAGEHVSSLGQRGSPTATSVRGILRNQAVESTKNLSIRPSFLAGALALSVSFHASVFDKAKTIGQTVVH
jgi:hypothetical protein